MQKSGQKSKARGQKLKNYTLIYCTGIHYLSITLKYGENKNP
jgi:hypothetical protein